MTKICWIPYGPEEDFSVHNLPFGVFMDAGIPTPGVAIGDKIIHLRKASELGLFEGTGHRHESLEGPYLNDFIAQGKKISSGIRERLMDELTRTDSGLFLHQNEILRDRKGVTMCMPIHIGDYTDFYSSEDHATNVGKMFRDPANALLPNWKHIPVGYHGRSSSIVISGTPIKRPKGQRKPPDSEFPVFGPSQRLDIELEVAFIIGKETALGDSVPVDAADDYIFGLVLFNDWSARDIQQWEYVPLGPFLAKNFASTMSPWIVPLEALEPFRTAGPLQTPEPLPYLQAHSNSLPNFDIHLDVFLKPESGKAHCISRSNFRYMYWSMRQQLAHHTINGCNIRTGDVMASGTISGPDKGSWGSLLELTWGGKEPLELDHDVERRFLEDGDEITILGYAEKDGIRVGFGECMGKILPSN